MADDPTFFNRMLGYFNAVDNSRLPPEEQRSAALGAYELMREAAARCRDCSDYQYDPDYQKVAFYAHFLPAWEERFKLILDGNEPKDRRSGQKITTGPKSE